MDDRFREGLKRQSDRQKDKLKTLKGHPKTRKIRVSYPASTLKTQIYPVHRILVDKRVFKERPQFTDTHVGSLKIPVNY